MRKLMLPMLALLLVACNIFQASVQVTQTPAVLSNQITPSNTALPLATPAPPEIPLPSATLESTAEPSLSPTFTASPVNPQPPAPPYFTIGESFTLTSIHMVSDTAGWGISGQYILVTRDGGLTWREVTPPEIFSSGTNVEAYGAFPEEQTAWVIFSEDSQISPGASVWITSDGGLTWKAGQPLLHGVYGDIVWAEFASLNARTGWIAIRGAWAGAGSHYDSQLFRTTDGGLTWENLVTSTDVDIAFQDFTGLVFSDEKTGWLTWQFLGAYISWPASYATTADGGSTWESHNLPTPAEVPDLYDKYWYCEPYQPNLLSPLSIRLLVVCNGGDLPAIGYLYATENAGTTWQIHPLPVVPKIDQGDRLFFFDPNNATLLGHEIYHTTDAGMTWTLITTVAWDHTQFDFINGQVGWAIVSIGDNPPALVKTNNGGKSWQEIKPVIGK